MTKVALFSGLLFINAARRVVVMHLIWWWQPLLGYFGSPFFLRAWRGDYSSWDAPLTWILERPRRNYSSNVFSLLQWAWASILGRDVFSDRMVLGPAQGPANLLFWASPHNSPSKLRFWSPSKEKSGVLTFTKDGINEVLVRACGRLLLTRHNLRGAAIYSR